MKDFTGNYKIGTLITDVQNLKPGSLYILKREESLFLIRITKLEWSSSPEHPNVYDATYKVVDPENLENRPIGTNGFRFPLRNDVELSPAWDYSVWNLETDVPVQDKDYEHAIVASEMFETLRAWCAWWVTVEEWAQNWGHDYDRGNYLQLMSMVDRKAYLRIDFGDMLDKDHVYKNVPDELPSFSEWKADEK